MPMQNMKEPGLTESEAATANGSPSPSASTAASKGKDPEREKLADQWLSEVIENLNRNALKGTPTS